MFIIKVKVSENKKKIEFFRMIWKDHETLAEVRLGPIQNFRPPGLIIKEIWNFKNVEKSLFYQISIFAVFDSLSRPNGWAYGSNFFFKKFIAKRSTKLKKIKSLAQLERGEKNCESWRFLAFYQKWKKWKNQYKSMSSEWLYIGVKNRLVWL